MARNSILLYETDHEFDPYENWFWKKIQEEMGSTIIPKYLRNALSMYGLAKGVLLGLCTDDHINEFKDFIRSPNYAAFVPPGANMQHYFGHYANRPESFELGFVGETVLTRMIEIAKTKPIEFWDPFSFDADLETIVDGHPLTEGSRSLMKVLFDIHNQNEDRNDHGNRFPKGIQLFCAFLKMTAGRLVYETLARNFRKSIPQCSTIDKFIRREGEQIIEGKIRVAQLKQFLLDRNLPLVIGLSEDACAIVSKIQYDALTDQGVGTVLPRDKHSMPIPGSFPATTVSNIQKIFREGTKSKLLYVHMAQPLVEDAPSFCLLMYGTDGKFTANDVIKRLNYMARLLEEEDIIVKYISSDGDPKLLRAHRIVSGLSEEQNSETPCSYTIDDETITLPEYHAYIKKTLIPNQDTVHIGTKLRNNLIKDSCILPMGNRMAMHTDLEDLVQLASKDKHKLTATDLRPNDKMNFKSVLKLCSEETIAQLKKHVKRSEATQMYLTCMNYVLKAYLCKNISITGRVYHFWYALFFFRLWRTWIMKHPVHNISANFISSNTYMCVELNGHCLIQMVLQCIEEDDFGGFYPWLIGSQSCESFFRAYRCDSTTQSLVVNCTVLEGTKKLRKIQMLQDILAYDFKKDKIDIEFPRNKFLHPSFETAGFQVDENSENVLDEDPGNRSITLSTLRASLDAAKRDALAAAMSLGMLNLTLSDADKCYVPTIPLKTIDIHVDDEDHDNDCHSRDAQRISDPAESRTEFLAEVGDPTRDLAVTRDEEIEEIQDDVNFLESIDDLQLVDYSAREFVINRSEKDYQFVKVTAPNGTGKLVRKSAIFWLLDQGNHKLSSDRLQRVKESALIDHTTVPQTFLPDGAESHQCDAIRKGEWCLFERVTTDPVQSNENQGDKRNRRGARRGRNDDSAPRNEQNINEVPPMQCLVGHVRDFAYMDCETISGTQYSNMFANVKGNKKNIGVMCYWFTIRPDGSLQEAETHTHGFIDIGKYVRTIRTPTEFEGRQYISRSVVEEYGPMCGPVEPSFEPMETA